MRTTTAFFGTAAAQSWVDQIRSLPEVTLTTSDSADTSQVQAGETLVVSSSVKPTDRPAYAGPLTVGVATTSLPTHGPLGTASGVGVGVGVTVRAALPFTLPVRAAVRVAAARGVWTVLLVGAEVEASAPTGCAVGPPEPPLPSSRAIPKTSANATATTSSRRVQ